MCYSYNQDHVETILPYTRADSSEQMLQGDTQSRRQFSHFNNTLHLNDTGT